jgi:mannosyltransferase OCH1-like enzyme
MNKVQKKIHYCWFGGSELNTLNLRCIESWERHFPDYEIIKWSENDIDLKDPLKKKLVKKKKWAFLSDLVRFELLYEHGGIYFDTDVEVIRGFESIGKMYDFVVGYETNKMVNAAVIVAAPKNEILLGCINQINEHYAHNSEMLPIPEIITPYLEEIELSRVYLAPKEVFYPYNPYDRERGVKQLMFSDITANTLAIHHYQKSWNFNLIDKIKKVGRSFKRRMKSK